MKSRTEPFGGVEVIAANSELGEIETIAAKTEAAAPQGGCEAQKRSFLCIAAVTHAATRIAAVFPDFGIPYTTEQQSATRRRTVVACAVGVACRCQLRGLAVSDDCATSIGCRLLTRFEDRGGHGVRTAAARRDGSLFALGTVAGGSRHALAWSSSSYRTRAGGCNGEQLSETDKRVDTVGRGAEISCGSWTSLAVLRCQRQADDRGMDSGDRVLVAATAGCCLIPRAKDPRSREAIAWQALRRGNARDRTRRATGAKPSRSLTICQTLLELIENRRPRASRCPRVKIRVGQGAHPFGRNGSQAVDPAFVSGGFE